MGRHATCRRRPPLERSPEALNLARREWLDGLRRRHAREPSAASAFELARGLHRCGEYDAALDAVAVGQGLQWAVVAAALLGREVAIRVTGPATPG